MDGANVHHSPIGKDQDLPQEVTPYKEFIKATDFGCPPLGMRAFGDTVGYISIPAVRQSNRGYHYRSTNVKVFNPSCFIECKMEYPYVGSPGMIWEVFNPKFYTLKEALKKFESGDSLGVPLSRRCAAYLLPTGRPRVAFNRWEVGEIIGDRIYLYKENADLARVVEGSIKQGVSVHDSR
jgi:hypothetical protein